MDGTPTATSGSSGSSRPWPATWSSCSTPGRGRPCSTWAAAPERLGADRVLLADGHAFTLPEPDDAVFSNAALHWMPRPSEVIARVRAALAPGGRFVAELGGAGNIDAILAAFAAALAEAGLPAPPPPPYFPTPRPPAPPP